MNDNLVLIISLSTAVIIGLIAVKAYFFIRMVNKSEAPNDDE